MSEASLETEVIVPLNHVIAFNIIHLMHVILRPQAWTSHLVTRAIATLAIAGMHDVRTHF